MQITSIRCADFLSFDEKGVEIGTDRDLTVLVGPNGAGKTNMVRALELVRLVLRQVGNPTSVGPNIQPNPEDQQLARWSEFGRHRGGLRPPTVSIGVELTTEREQEMVAVFLRAAVTSAFLSDGSEVQDALPIDRESLRDLFRATLVVTGPTRPGGRWSATLRFCAGDVAYTWILSSEIGTYGLGRSGDDTAPLQSFDAAVPSEPEVINLADLLPQSGQRVDFKVDKLNRGTGLTESQRRFVEIFDISSDQQLSGRFFNFGLVVWHIIDEGLVLTANARVPPGASVLLADPGSRPTLADGSGLPLALFSFKNGDAQERARFALVQQLFKEIVGDGSTFNVLVTAPAAADGVHQVTVMVLRSGYEVPIELAGHGLWEACLLATLIAGDGDQVVVLDEPGTNLHPTLQCRLPVLLQQAAGQIVVITHSPNLVPVSAITELGSIVRISSEAGVSQARTFTSPAGDQDLDKLLQRLGRDAELRGLVFANGVVLVEGDTELGVLPVWLSQSARRRRQRSPEELNVAVFDVGGQNEFEKCVRWLHAFDIPWVVCGDGGMFRPTPKSQHIFSQLTRALGDASPPDLAEAAHAMDGTTTFDWCKEVGERIGVFTLARGWDTDNEGIETYFRELDPTVFAELSKQYTKSKSRLGRHFAERVECPPELDAFFSKMLDHLHISAG